MASDQLLMCLTLRDLCLKEGPWAGSPGLTLLWAGSCPSPLDLALWFSRNPGSGASGGELLCVLEFSLSDGDSHTGLCTSWDFCKE